MLQSKTVTDSASPDPPVETNDFSVDAAPRAANRLFVLPAIVTGIVVCVLALYFLFGAITRDTRTADSYLAEVRGGQGNRRWQAAYELSRLLESSQTSAPAGTAATARAALREAVEKGDDPRVTRYLALALGRIGDRSAVQELTKVLTDTDAETRIYSAISLGRIGDRGATAALGAALSDEDAGVRKSAAYALGVLADPASSGPLRDALHDREIDVTWNAAVALARMGDPSGVDVLRSMADREFVERASQSEDPSTRSTVLVTAVKALVMLKDHQSEATLQKLAERDPDLSVRQAAIEALRTLSGDKAS